MNKFVVVIFPSEAKADEAAEIFRDLHKEGSLTLYGLAIARKTEDDQVLVVEKKKEGLPGTGVGALAGALVGLVGGPFTAVLGAAAGAWIGTWRDIEHLGVGSDFIEEVADALTPNSVALVADVSEDRVAYVDEQMELLGGVVLREWQSELPEMKLAADAAARKAELEQLNTERLDAPPKRQKLIEIRIDKAKARLEETSARARAKLESIDTATAARLDELNRQAASAGPSSRTSIERRIAETKNQSNRRAALLRHTLEVVDAARM